MSDNPTTDQTLEELASVHTDSFTQLLRHFGFSLAISTYQAGKLIIARDDGSNTNTHFRNFDKPMGMVATQDRLALGTASQIWNFRNVPAAAGRLLPEGRHDAAYLMRDVHVTGDVDVHEMCWVDEELWFINTRFSCLCTLDPRHSFVPRWRPPFITAYDMRDRCHLNGLAVRDGRPRYITALGEADEPGGWRRNKAAGGILMDIDNNEFLLRGLSMPHSPRWYKNNLWFLESGKGALSYYDADTGTAKQVAELPGFTRGLDFVGDYAVIGLSKVRETAVFAGLPLTQSQPVRHCGVWVVDIKDGQIKAFLRFEKGVQEIFAVTLLPWKFPDVINDDRALLGTTYTLPDEALNNAVQPAQDWSFAESHFEAGNTLYNEGKPEEALAEYRKCLEMQPDFLPARYNLGVAFGNLYRHEEAIAELKKVIADEAGHSEALNSLGFNHGQLRRNAEAVDYLRRAIEIRPDYAQAHQNLGLILLAMGEYAEGWEESEWRWQTPQFKPFETPHPQWEGETLQGTLLVHTEQGAGDAIQFARYLPMCAERCDRIMLVCPEHLVKLFSVITGVDECRGPGELDKNAFQARISLMSLPRIFGTNADNIPAVTPYLIVPTPNQPVLPKGKTGGLKVGIVWAGNPDHSNNRLRSCDIEEFLPVLRVPGIDFYSLQKGECVKDLLRLPEDVSVIDLDTLINDYADTAALAQQLDLIISVDTSVAHLAAALDKATWTLVYYNADWRYQRDRKDCLWYPSMRQFWQAEPMQWQPVFAQLAQALTTFGKTSA
ncbi:MAG: TIGR03032 family protein [Gammaproteobacteria bacterium]